MKISRLYSINVMLLLPIAIIFLLLIPSIVQLETSDLNSLEIEAYFRDPASTIWQLTTLDSPFVGIYSQVGVVLWFSGATIGLFAAFLLYIHDKQTAFMIASVALVGLMLGTDDLLLVHERIAPQFFHVGEHYVFLVYAALIGIVIRLFGRQIWQYDKFFLLIAGVFLVGSLGVDFVEEVFDAKYGQALQGLLEDSFKLLGIAAYWTGLFKISAKSIQKVLAPKQRWTSGSVISSQSRALIEI